MIDNTPQELIYCRAAGIDVSLAMSVQSINASISVKDFSVDNQLLCNRKNQIIPGVNNGFEFLKFELEAQASHILSNFCLIDLIFP